MADPQELLPGAPVAVVSTPDGNTVLVRLLDDGVHPDLAAQDRVWTHPVHNLRATSVQVDVQSGDETWHGSFTLDSSLDKPMLRVRPEDDGGLVDDMASPPPPGVGAPPPPQLSAAPSIGASGPAVPDAPALGLADVGWAVVALGGGVLLGRLRRS